ncbi:MAG TPA: FKBP-type peptidyl-prolyl cis-trans isomerase [Gemmatimonadaceae bacterium]|nr:FKBP-type peptidyl-prolyl cis-trans isomerase [Gemmatimonadaceae bacterium]
MKRLLLLIATLSLGACNLDTAPDDNPSDPAHETFDPSLKIDLATMTKTTNGVYYKDLVAGTGTTLTNAQSIVMSFGAFVKTGAVFGTGDHVNLSVASMPAGLQEGMSGMKIGGERLIVIPSALGYGNSPFASVPPNSTLIYDVFVYSFQ